MATDASDATAEAPAAISAASVINTGTEGDLTGATTPLGFGLRSAPLRAPSRPIFDCPEFFKEFKTEKILCVFAAAVAIAALRPEGKPPTPDRPDRRARASPNSGRANSALQRTLRARGPLRDSASRLPTCHRETSRLEIAASVSLAG
jgi:hypothetical protein